MAEGVQTQLVIDERVVADFSEIEDTNHTRRETDVHVSVRDRITLIEARRSIDPQHIRFGFYLHSVCTALLESSTNSL